MQRKHLMSKYLTIMMRYKFDDTQQKWKIFYKLSCAEINWWFFVVSITLILIQIDLKLMKRQSTLFRDFLPYQKRGLNLWFVNSSFFSFLMYFCSYLYTLIIYNISWTSIKEAQVVYSHCAIEKSNGTQKDYSNLYKNMLPLEN